jgi:hypothetical protein
VRRFIIFALAGPPLGVFVAIFIVVPLVALLQGTKFEFNAAQVETFLALVPFSYIVGLIPAVLTGLADWAVRDVRTPLRILCVTAAGYVFGFLPLWWPLTGSAKTSDWAFGLAGAVAGAACSWLTAISDEQKRHWGSNYGRRDGRPG